MNPKIVWTKWAVQNHPGFPRPWGGFATAKQARRWAAKWMPGGFLLRCRGPQSALWARRRYVQVKLG